jgi:hypothetical protein
MILININGVKEIHEKNTNVVIMTNKISNEMAGGEKEEIESVQMNRTALYLKGKKREKAVQRELNWSRFLNTRKPQRDWTFQYISKKIKVVRTGRKMK